MTPPAPAATPAPQPQPSGNGQGNSYRQRQQFRNENSGNHWKEKRQSRRQDADYGQADFDGGDDEQFTGNASDYEGRTVIDLMELQSLGMNALTKRALELNMEGVGSLSRHDLMFEMVKNICITRNAILRGGGILEVMSDGNGFLRSPHFSYLPCPEDVFLNGQQIRRWGLRTGDMVIGQVRQPRERDRSFVMVKIDTINGETPDRKRETVPFENLVPYFPTQRILLEHDHNDLTTRVIDLITPIGRGQRGLIVAAPRTGKTVVMQKIANSIMANNDDIELIVLLIDERPEEVTDMRRMVKGEVVSSTFDEPPDRHVQVAEMVIEKAKRMVEHGRHVVILLDSITRLARAYNTVEPHSGRILTGGVDANALHKPKRFFGAARNIENGGSLTILATALIDTGSRMDEVIFEEFKGTGNMELHLDRHLVEKRIYPAISIEKSGTRREELLVHPEELKRIWSLRKALVDLPQQEAMETLLGKIKEKGSNAEFLMSINVGDND
ncbi:MAG: transcription termination factor Rho [Victivallales bacterium]|nr:transcription termination factor Rho [Victivallales bacterium]